jgi:ParB-like chromosome segregation protein Spo0J
MTHKIEQLSVDSLIPYSNNARTHSDDQVTQIASSIKEFGFNNPILVDKTNGVIAGHGRLMAAKKLGMDTVPCIKLEHLTDAQRKAFILADNKIALNSGWDYELLKVEVENLSDEDFRLELLGFDVNELNTILGIEEEIKDDKEISDDGNRNLLLVEFDNEIELENLFNEMQERGFNCKIMN